MKNILGHLPDLWYNYETLLKYFGCHTVTFDRSDITKSSLEQSSRQDHALKNLIMPPKLFAIY